MAGRRPVEEAFVARRPAIRLLVVPQRRAALEKLVLHATNLRIPIVEVEGGSLTSLAGFDGHQGVALVVEPRQYASLDDVLARAKQRDEPPFVLVLDSLEDPHNVGTLLRSAEAAGIHGVLFPTHRQAPLSPSAVKASAGAIEHLLLCPVDDLAGALSDLHARGIRIAGAEGDAPMTARESDLRGPLAIVVGSEGQGLGPAVRRRADLFMRIPMKGAVGSLNAAVAGSILLFEALAQRDPNAAPRLEPAPGIVGGPEPTATATPTKRGRKGRSTESDESVGSPDEIHGPDSATPANADEVADSEPNPTPRARKRKGLSTEPDEAPDAPEDARREAPAAAGRTGRVRKRSATAAGAPTVSDPAASAAPTTVQRAPRKPRVTADADPSAPATASPEEDLLPPDGAKKRPPRAG